MPWLSFCISTYKRPEFLYKQLEYISNQSFQDFEVIISDNDPACSARIIIKRFDNRFLYFPNNDNIGMIESFNKSIERSKGEYLLLITDDDYIDDSQKLEKFYSIYQKYPHQAIYINCLRKGRQYGNIEICAKDDFAYQLLNPHITKTFLWSDCILKSSVVKNIGGIPNYGSPHLADHALLALCSKEYGGVFLNNISAKINSHDSNFSRSNLELYYIACNEFYLLISSTFSNNELSKDKNALTEHLIYWATQCMFSLRGFFLKNNNQNELKNLRNISRKIFALPFMKHYIHIYKIKLLLFNIQNLKKNFKYYWTYFK